MPQSKTITLQELASIFRQYNSISVHHYSPDGRTGLTIHFNSASLSLYKAGGTVKQLDLANDIASFCIEGPAVKVVYEPDSTPSYMALQVLSHGMAFRITMA